MPNLKRKSHILNYEISHNLHGFLPNMDQCALAVDELYQKIIKNVIDRPEYDSRDTYTVQINKWRFGYKCIYWRK